MFRKHIEGMVQSGLRQVDLTECVTDTLLLNVITTYDNHYEQQIWDMNVKVIKTEFRSKIEPYNLPPTMKIIKKDICGGIYSPEKHILGQVITDITPLNRLPQLCKISLSYKNMGKICPSAYKNRDPKNEKDKLEIDRKLDELGFGFIMRTHSKYYFQLDQRDAFETDIVETFKNSKKVRSYMEFLKEWKGEEPSKQEIESHQEVIKEKREETAKYFGCYLSA
jgi:hypothetical protein